jgi:hypothetical protein
MMFIYDEVVILICKFVTYRLLVQQNDRIYQGLHSHDSNLSASTVDTILVY